MAKQFSRFKDTPKYVTELSRKFRADPTPHEEMLWTVLSGRKLCGAKFRRQFPIGRYIVDFYNHASRLVIEVDGGIHSLTKDYDRNRADYLNACGYTVLRFTNSEIETNIEYVLQKIEESIKVPLRGTATKWRGASKERSG